jgi:hypothetical protein
LSQEEVTLALGHETRETIERSGTLMHTFGNEEVTGVAKRTDNTKSGGRCTLTWGPPHGGEAYMK